MKRLISGLIVALVLVLMSSVYTVNEVQRVVVIRLGKPVGKPIDEAGLRFKIPFMDKVKYFDKRLLDYDSEPKELITKDKKKSSNR